MGDENLDPIALAKAHLDLAIGIARNFGKRHPALWDEFESEAFVSLWRAALGYRPDGRHTFYDHARFVISRSLFNVFDRWRPKGYRRNRSARRLIVASIEGASEGSIQAEGIPGRDDHRIVEFEVRDSLVPLMKCLTPKQASYIQSYFFDYFHEENPLELTARRFGRSEPAVSQVIKAGLDRMRFVANGGRLSNRQAQVASRTVPCADCGTKGGHSGESDRPTRISGKRFGVAGSLCRDCYYRRHRRAEK